MIHEISKSERDHLMTIAQLKYVIAIDEESSMRKAADRLYVSQPGLSSSVRELENELGIQIFERVHNGVVTTSAGASFIAYARNAVEQFEKVEEKYLNTKHKKPTFSVSMQHYTIAVETQTGEVIEDVKNLRSEVGVIALSDFNKKTFKKIFTDASLEFHELFTRDAYVYLSKHHPLASRDTLSLKDLQDYPCMVFDQGEQTSFYYREEALATYDYKKVISTNERATSIELMLGLNGYAVGAAMLGSGSTSSDIRVIKLLEDETLTFGYIVRKGQELSEMAETFIEKLTNHKTLS